jgi:succinate dehydrogenase / fumarate reductase flavoprotein subunit
VDYELMSTVQGLYVLGEANFSDHGANRLGASALMQGLGDGYFVLPNTIGNYLAQTKLDEARCTDPAFREAEQGVDDRVTRLLSINGTRSVDSFHKELGRVMWNECGMARSDASLRRALARIPEIREEFWSNLRVLGQGEELNQSLERAGRVADFLELAELLCIDALHRTESCGGHFRVESQTPDGEALRDDEHFTYAAAWQYQGQDKKPKLYKEPLTFDTVHMATRSYK